MKLSITLAHNSPSDRDIPHSNEVYWLALPIFDAILYLKRSARSSNWEWLQVQITSFGFKHNKTKKKTLFIPYFQEFMLSLPKTSSTDIGEYYDTSTFIIHDIFVMIQDHQSEDYLELFKQLQLKINTYNPICSRAASCALGQLYLFSKFEE